MEKPALFVAKEFPWPIRTGGHHRTAGLVTMLSSVANVRLVASPNRWATGAVHPFLANVEYTASGRRSGQPILRRAGRMMCSWSPRWSSLPSTIAVRTAVRRQLTEPTDVVLYDELSSARILLDRSYRNSRTKVIYSSHHVESRLSYPYRGCRPFRRLLCRRDMHMIGHLEELVVREADGIIAVCDEEAEIFKAMSPAPILVIPNYSSSPVVPGPDWQKRKGVVLAGSFSWLPNRDGLLWFVREVLPRLDASVYPVTVISNRLAARDRTALARNDVNLHTNVDDISSELIKYRVSAVPVLAGAGSRVRIPEAMGAGLRVVATTKGAEGQPLSVMDRIGIADNADAFARLVEYAHGGTVPDISIAGGWLDHIDAFSSFVSAL